MNGRFAQKMFGRESAVGQMVTSGEKTYEIVGVVENTKSTTLSEEDEPILIESIQKTLRWSVGKWHDFTV